MMHGLPSLRPPKLQPEQGNRVWAGYLFVEARGARMVIAHHAQDALIAHARQKGHTLGVGDRKGGREGLGLEGDLQAYLGIEPAAAIELRARMLERSEWPGSGTSVLAFEPLYEVMIAARARRPGGLGDMEFWAGLRLQMLEALRRIEDASGGRVEKERGVWNVLKVAAIYKNEQGGYKTIRP